jgi:hypothetical protein
MKTKAIKSMLTLGSLILMASLSIGCSEVEFSPDKSVEGLNQDESITPDPNPAPGPQFMAESFKQKDRDPAVDILIVVDNSGSMSADQLKLGQKISSFLGYMAGVDWHLGIVTTDVSPNSVSANGAMIDFPGTGSHILTQNTPDYLNKFLSTVVRSETGSGDEQAMRAVQLAIEQRNGANAGFFRDETDFVVIVLSDEDERSTGASGTTGTDVINTFKAAWGNTKRIDGYGIVIRPGDTACYNEQNPGGSYGTYVDGFAKKTRGVLGSICDADFGPTLATIGSRVRTLLTTFDLSQKPLPSSIRIKFTPSHATTWYLNGQTLEINNPPKAGTIVDVSYQVKE